ncbi:MAG: glycerate kinase, partial [Dehalococcoidia bacterium]
MTRVLVAPQEFKGSLTAAEAAQAIAAGLRRAQPGWTLDLLPMSDGGPGFIEAMAAATPGELATCKAHDALGRPRSARYLIVDDPRTAVLEAAQANGLVLIPERERDVLSAGTAGVGEIIAAALSQHPSRLTIGVGGSATNDGGAGMAQALGARLSDEAGRQLPPGAAALERLARIDWQRPQALFEVEVVVATDVTNPLLGPNGASAVYGPQKGATAAQIDQLEAALTRYAAVVRRSLGGDIATLPGGGAAGGLAAGLVAFLGARIESGFDVVAEVSGLAQRLAAAAIVVTGEGSFDGQSMQGKTTGRLLALARDAARPCIVLAGRGTPVAGVELRDLAELEPDGRAAMRDAAALLEELTYRQFATESG